jgi:hypothetical protein
MVKALRDSLGLLGLLVVLVGVSSTEAYYGTFGLRYQFLSVPAQHFLYRGLSSVFESWAIATLYLLGLSFIVCQSRMALFLGGLDRLRVVNYLLVVLLAFSAWFAAGSAGAKAAIQDSGTAQSGLPKIVKLIPKGDAQIESIDSASQGYRLLLQVSGGIYMLRGVNNPASEEPIVRFVSGGSINAMSLCTRC